ncbi:MAG: NUDIX domain-containing protein [Planctomycetales bacterium]|nr:NUDIX domain-containing protein [Planctomycetales bacterium]
MSTPTSNSLQGMVQRRRGVVAVITQHDRFLVIRRSQWVTAPRAFCFPGGGIEAGESEAEAILRELDEELAITQAEAVRRVWTSTTRRQVDLAWWLVRLPEMEIELRPNPDEVESYGWWHPADIRANQEFLESNQEFMQAWQTGEFDLLT